MISQFIAPLYNLLLVSAFVGLFSSFWIAVANITGARNEAVLHSNAFLGKLLSCDFCLSFWFGVLVSSGGYFFIPDPDWILVAILSTPISKMFL